MWVWLAGLALCLAVTIAYHNTFDVPFVLDDRPCIVDNPTIRQLWPVPWTVPPSMRGDTVDGRPLVNFTLALNYALGGLEVRGYHVFNVAVHLLAALTLLGLVRRTLLSPRLRARFESKALALAFATALLWAVHPLTTQAVTYVIQRAESLASLFYLLTLYCLVRGADGKRRPAWYAGSFAACLLGMASKEVVVSAPLIALLYDRTFLTGSFREALKQRRGLYLALASTWVLLIVLMVSTGNRGTTTGFDTGIGVWGYLRTEFWAIVQYLRLSFWPSPLVFDYGTELLGPGVIVWPRAAIALLLLSLTAAALWRWPGVGFLGACFFALLAPTSSFVPVATPIVEHRMYLALASVIAAAVVTCSAGLARAAPRRPSAWWRAVPVVLLIAAATGLAGATIDRNGDYRTPLALWQDTVQKRPESSRAHYDLGHALSSLGRLREAIGEYAVTIRLNPGYRDAYTNLGVSLMAIGKVGDAIKCYEKVVELAPADADAYATLGNALFMANDVRRAIDNYRKAIQLDPSRAIYRSNIGYAMFALGDIPKALAYYKEALELDPGHAETHNNMALAMVAMGDIQEALLHYERALGGLPLSAEVHNNYGHALLLAGRVPDAIAQYRRALDLNPGHPDARQNLERAVGMLKGADEKASGVRR